MKIITYLLLISVFSLTSCYTKFAAEGDNTDDYGYRQDNRQEQMQQYDGPEADSVYYSQDQYEDNPGYDNSNLPQIDIVIGSDYRPWDLHRRIYFRDGRWRHHIVIDPIIYIDPYYAYYYYDYDYFYDPWDVWWSYPGYTVYPVYPPYYPYYPAYDPYYGGGYYGYWGGGYGGYAPPIVHKTPRSFDDRHPSAPVRRSPRRPGSGSGNDDGLASRPVYRPVGGSGGSGNHSGDRTRSPRRGKNTRPTRILHTDDHGAHLSGLAGTKSNRPKRTAERAKRRVAKQKYTRHYYGTRRTVKSSAPKNIRQKQKAPRRSKYIAPKSRAPKKVYRSTPRQKSAGSSRKHSSKPTQRSYGNSHGSYSGSSGGSHSSRPATRSSSGSRSKSSSRSTGSSRSHRR